MIEPDKRSLKPASGLASEWTDEIKLTHEAESKIECYFNRGIVAAPWVSRRLGVIDDDLKTKKLTKIIATPNDPFRAYLTGPLGKRLFELLDKARSAKANIYAALYELEDEQLKSALEKIGKRARR
jgi:hypothetical protein